MIDGLETVSMSRKDHAHCLVDRGWAKLIVEVEGDPDVIDRLEEQIQSLIYEEDTSNA